MALLKTLPCRESKQVSEEKKGFWARNKKFIIGLVVVWVVLLILLVLMTDQKNLPFVYQFG